MKIYMRCLRAAPAIILAVLCAAASTTSSSLAQSAQSPEQHLASINDARRELTDFLNGLASAVQAEKRDDGWAAQKEAALRTSFAVERSLPRDALQSVDCRSSKCSLQLYLSAPAEVEQQAAITRWIAVSQPCAYTMTNPSQTMLIFLDCRR
jgi:hypothetical protein